MLSLKMHICTLPTTGFQANYNSTSKPTSMYLLMRKGEK